MNNTKIKPKFIIKTDSNDVKYTQCVNKENEEQILEETGSYQHSSVNRSLFNVDHDHKTGKVRGWICTYCNNMLARSRDNPETLRNGAKYLEENNG